MTSPQLHSITTWGSSPFLAEDSGEQHGSNSTAALTPAGFEQADAQLKHPSHPKDFPLIRSFGMPGALRMPIRDSVLPMWLDGNVAGRAGLVYAGPGGPTAHAADTGAGHTLPDWSAGMGTPAGPGQLLATMGDRRVVTAMAVSSDCTRLVVASADLRLLVFTTGASGMALSHAIDTRQLMGHPPDAASAALDATTRFASAARVTLLALSSSAEFVAAYGGVPPAAELAAVGASATKYSLHGLYLGIWKISSGRLISSSRIRQPIMRLHFRPVAAFEMGLHCLVPGDHALRVQRLLGPRQSDLPQARRGGGGSTRAPDGSSADARVPTLPSTALVLSVSGPQLLRLWHVQQDSSLQELPVLHSKRREAEVFVDHAWLQPAHAPSFSEASACVSGQHSSSAAFLHGARLAVLSERGAVFLFTCAGGTLRGMHGTGGAPLTDALWEGLSLKYELWQEVYCAVPHGMRGPGWVWRHTAPTRKELASGFLMGGGDSELGGGPRNATVRAQLRATRATRAARDAGLGALGVDTELLSDGSSDPEDARVPGRRKQAEPLPATCCIVPTPGGFAVTGECGAVFVFGSAATVPADSGRGIPVLDHLDAAEAARAVPAVASGGGAASRAVADASAPGQVTSAQQRQLYRWWTALRAGNGPGLGDAVHLASDGAALQRSELDMPGAPARGSHSSQHAARLRSGRWVPPPGSAGSLAWADMLVAACCVPSAMWPAIGAEQGCGALSAAAAAAAQHRGSQGAPSGDLVGVLQQAASSGSDNQSPYLGVAAALRSTARPHALLAVHSLGGGVRWVPLPTPANVSSQGMGRLQQDASLPLAVRGYHVDPVTAVSLAAWSPVAASVSAREGTVRLWNMVTNACDAVVPVSEGPLTSVCMHPGGSLVAVGTAVSVRLYHRLPHDLLLWHRAQQANVHALAYSHAGGHLAVAAGYAVFIYSAWDMSLLFTLRAHMGVVRSVTWSGNDCTLATAAEDGAVMAWCMTGPAPTYSASAAAAGAGNANRPLAMATGPAQVTDVVAAPSLLNNNPYAASTVLRSVGSMASQVRDSAGPAPRSGSASPTGGADSGSAGTALQSVAAPCLQRSENLSHVLRAAKFVSCALSYNGGVCIGAGVSRRVLVVTTTSSHGHTNKLRHVVQFTGVLQWRGAEGGVLTPITQQPSELGGELEVADVAPAKQKSWASAIAAGTHRMRVAPHTPDRSGPRALLLMLHSRLQDQRARERGERELHRSVTRRARHAKASQSKKDDRPASDSGDDSSLPDSASIASSCSAASSPAGAAGAKPSEAFSAALVQAHGINIAPLRAGAVSSVGDGPGAGRGAAAPAGGAASALVLDGDDAVPSIMAQGVFITCMQLNVANTLLYAGCSDGTIRVYPFPLHCAPVSSSGLPEGSSAASKFHRASARAAVGIADPNLASTAFADAACTIVHAHSTAVVSLQLAWNGAVLVSCSDDGSVALHGVPQADASGVHRRSNMAPMAMEAASTKQRMSKAVLAVAAGLAGTPKSRVSAADSGLELMAGGQSGAAAAASAPGATVNRSNGGVVARALALLTRAPHYWTPPSPAQLQVDVVHLERQFVLALYQRIAAVASEREGLRVELEQRLQLQERESAEALTTQQNEHNKRLTALQIKYEKLRSEHEAAVKDSMREKTSIQSAAAKAISQSLGEYEERLALELERFDALEHKATQHVAEYQAELARTQEQAQSAQATASDAIQELQATLADQRRAFETERAAAAAQSDSILRDTEREYEKEIAMIQSRAAQVEASHDKAILERDRMITLLERRTRDLRKAAAVAERLLDDRAKSIAALKREASQLQQALSLRDEKIRALTDGVAERETALGVMKSDVRVLNGWKSVLEQRADMLATAQAPLEQQVDRMTESMAAMNTELLAEHTRSLTNKMDTQQLKSKFTAAETEKRRLQTVLRARDLEIAAIKRDIAAALAAPAAAGAAGIRGGDAAIAAALRAVHDKYTCDQPDKLGQPAGARAGSAGPTRRQAVAARNATSSVANLFMQITAGPGGVDGAAPGDSAESKQGGAARGAVPDALEESGPGSAAAGISLEDHRATMSELQRQQTYLTRSAKQERYQLSTSLKLSRQRVHSTMGENSFLIEELNGLRRTQLQLRNTIKTMRDSMQRAGLHEEAAIGTLALAGKAPGARDAQDSASATPSSAARSTPVWTRLSSPVSGVSRVTTRSQAAKAGAVLSGAGQHLASPCSATAAPTPQYRGGKPGDAARALTFSPAALPRSAHSQAGRASAGPRSDDSHAGPRDAQDLTASAPALPPRPAVSTGKLSGSFTLTGRAAP